MSHPPMTESHPRPRASSGTHTLSDLLFELESPALRRELEAYRLGWERDHGPVDLTRYYTCLWPEEAADWLIRHDPQRYYDGLPDFVKGFIRDRFDELAAEGRLDFAGGPLLRLYVQGRLKPGHGSRDR